MNRETRTRTRRIRQGQWRRKHQTRNWLCPADRLLSMVLWSEFVPLIQCLLCDFFHLRPAPVIRSSSHDIWGAGSNDLASLNVLDNPRNCAAVIDINDLDAWGNLTSAFHPRLFKERVGPSRLSNPERVAVLWNRLQPDRASTSESAASQQCIHCCRQGQVSRRWKVLVLTGSGPGVVTPGSPLNNTLRQWSIAAIRSCDAATRYHAAQVQVEIHHAGVYE